MGIVDPQSGRHNFIDFLVSAGGQLLDDLQANLST